MTAFDQTSIQDGMALPARRAPAAARQGSWLLLWLGLTLVAAMLLLAALGEGETRAPGPPSITVGTAVHIGDAA